MVQRYRDRQTWVATKQIQSGSAYEPAHNRGSKRFGEKRRAGRLADSETFRRCNSLPEME